MEIEVGDRLRCIYLDSETEGSAEDDMEEDDNDGEE